MTKTLSAQETVKLLLDSNHELRAKLLKAQQAEESNKTSKKELVSGMELRKRLEDLEFGLHLKRIERQGF